MVDLEYQFTHPCGACSLCGGDVDNVRTRSDDDTDKDDDDADAPSVASDDDSDHVQDGPNDDAPDGPNGQSVERRRGDWMRSFSLLLPHLGWPTGGQVSHRGVKKAGGYHCRVAGGILWNWHHDTGFLMHQACWELLDTLCGVSYRRALGVFTSIPTYDARVPSWGHEYSLKPVRKDYYPQYPWRTCDIYGQKSRPDPLAANPRLAAREFSSLLATSPIPPEEAGEWDTVFESVDQSCDAFFRLPAEIRLEIGLLLGFDDVVALRLASKAFSFLFHDQQFWASQFLAPHGTRRWLLGNEYEYLLLAEREWMLEAKDLIPHMIRAASKNGTDWRWLFRQTGKRRSATNNLGRIWGLAKQLKVILDLEFPRNDAPTFPYGQQAHDQPIAAPCTPYSTRQKLSQIEWQYQPWVGELEDTGPQFQSTRLVFLPDDLSRLSFSFVPLGGKRYLAGIVFHARRTEEDLWLGYHNTAEPLETVEINRDFCGFELAVGSRGIQGISCVDGEGRAIGDWVGLDPRHAHKLPVTSRLSCRARTKILAVRAHFDVSFKIRKRGLEHVPRGERKDLAPLLTTFEQGLRFILLSVASEHTVRIFEEKPYEFDEGAFTMRLNGVWYPGLPTDRQGEDQYLHIWDEHALHAGRLCQGYKPLTWICFGGWGGSALSHITNMSVLLHGKFSPRQFTIKFSYDSAYNAQDDSWRERHAMLSTRATAHPELEEAFEDFPIDGARGEFIVNVGMLMHFSEGYVHSAHRRRDFEANGFPVGINVRTNRGRSKAFTVKSDVVRSGPPETYWLAPTENMTPILGFYAGEIDKAMGFQLGVLGLAPSPSEHTDLDGLLRTKCRVAREGIQN